jgi:branched-chain amino acid transport system permease protein
MTERNEIHESTRVARPIEGPTGLRSGWPWIAALTIILAMGPVVPTVLNPYLFSILMYSGINAILAASLNLVNGFTGQFSMGHAGFMSVGGYVSAFLSTTLAARHPELFADPAQASLLFAGVLLAGGIAAAIAGYLVGLPSLRLKGDYLAIVTLGFGEIIRVFVLNIDAIGGARGMPNIPQLTSFDWVYGFLVITLFILWRMVRSPEGREFLAVREDEIAAESMGVNTTKAKVRAFVVGAFFAGVSGGLFGHFLQYLSPQSFDFNRSFEIIIMVVLGGMGSLSGSVIAAFLLTGLREALRPLQEITKLDFRMVIYSSLLIVLMLTRPNGLLGTREIPDFFSFRRKKPRETLGKGATG